MVETIGKKLCQARLARGLSIEEAAHMTRVRPEKLIALENDDYGRFGSNAYAKGFLQLYGRFLNVDVQEYVQTLEIPRYVTISDYQYLNNAPEPEPSRIQINRHEHQRPSVLPLVFMLGLMVVGAVFAAGYMFNVTMERLEPKTAKQAPSNQSAPAVASDSTPASPTHGAGEIKPVPSPVPSPRVTEPELIPVSKPQPPAEAGSIHADGVEVVPQVPVAQGQSVDTSASVNNEVVVEPLKKTWVKIRRNSPNATPVFEDFVYPGAGPLKLRGDKFFVEVRDENAVQIRKNGRPIAYQAPGISIQ